MSVFSNPAGRASGAAHAYVEAVLDILGDRDPLTVLDAGPRRLRELTAGLADTDLRRPEREGKWSIIEVTKHLADAELVASFRYRITLAQDKPRITGFDQDAWARELGYHKADLEETVDLYRAVRNTNVALLRALTKEQLQRVGIHEERGPESVELLMKLMAGHDLIHQRQIERIRKTPRPEA